MSQPVHAGNKETKRQGRFIKPLKNIENATEEEKELTAIINKKQSEEQGISIPQTHLRIIIDKILQDVAADENHSKTAEGDNIAYNIRALAFATIHRATEEYLTDLLANALQNNTGKGEILAAGSVQRAAMLMLENKKMKLRYGEDYPDVSLDNDLDSEQSNTGDAESEENTKKMNDENDAIKTVPTDNKTIELKEEKKKMKAKSKRKEEENCEGVSPGEVQPKKKAKKNDGKKMQPKVPDEPSKENGTEIEKDVEIKKKKKNSEKKPAIAKVDIMQVKENVEKKEGDIVQKKRKKKTKKGEVDLENVVLDEVD
eukprot:2650653-Rhodomonas_salina.2